jgi:exodeoxyribonuclease VII large subunit
VPVQDAKKAIRTNAIQLLELTKTEFANETKHFRNAAQLYLNRSGQVLQNASRTIQGQAKTLLGRNNEVINGTMNELRMSGLRLIKNQQLELGRANEILSLGSKRVIEKSQKELDNIQGMVRLLDPKNVLKRGFSISTFKGKTIKPEMKIKVGDTIETTTFEYKLTTVIKDIEDNEQRD